MLQCVVIADDLTGANATGVLLKKLNLKTVSLMNSEGIEFQNLSQYDVITYSTDSRAVSPQQAYQSVYKATQLLKAPGIKLYNKRIDSTLRGNIGAEIDGILDGLGDDRIAIVVPAFPQAGRIAVGGFLLVNNLLLEKTDVAKDPRNPITTSVIENLAAKETRYKVESIFLDTVYAGSEAIRKKIKDCAQRGSRILIIDALQVEDLKTIAEAVLKSEIAFITIDPGPFTAIMAEKLIAPKIEEDHKKVLMVIGSISKLTKIQLEATAAAYSLYVSEIKTDKLLYDEKQRQEEISRVVSDISDHKDEGRLFGVVVDTVRPEKRLDLAAISQKLTTSEAELATIINNSVAEIAKRILKAVPEFKGIFSSGGDITVAICRLFKAYGMELLQEVYPLVAYGRLEGGEFSGLEFVTKGGMVGDKDGMKACIHFLMERL